jgi:asparagine synthase (glutamine-hydrolysing)
MGHSLEVRLPFLDHRVVEFVFQLSARHKFDGVESKIVLKRALRDVLPAEILGRKDKIGFYTPVGDWLRQFMRTEVRPLLLSACARRRGIFDAVRLEDALARVERGDDTLGEQVFCWLSLEIWFRLFIDGASLPGRSSLRVEAAK